MYGVLKDILNDVSSFLEILLNIILSCFKSLSIVSTNTNLTMKISEILRKLSDFSLQKGQLDFSGIMWKKS